MNDFGVRFQKANWLKQTNKQLMPIYRLTGITDGLDDWLSICPRLTSKGTDVNVWTRIALLRSLRNIFFRPV